MEKSAVEWLIDQLFELRNPTLNQIEIIKEAKDIERQQIIECGNSCAMKQHLHIERIDKMSMDEMLEFSKEETITFGEQYYNETFKK